jgi:hypothetical protein
LETEILKLSEWVEMGWECIETVYFKQSLFPLTPKWSLPFPLFINHALAAACEKATKIMYSICNCYHPTFPALTTTEKIEMVKATRETEREMEKVDAFFRKVEVRLGYLEKMFSFCSDDVVNAGVAFERCWKMFKKNQGKFAPDQMQVLEREIMLDLSNREESLNAEIRDFNNDLFSKTVTPLTLHISPVNALEKMHLLHSSISHLEEKYNKNKIKERKTNFHHFSSSH